MNIELWNDVVQIEYMCQINNGHNLRVYFKIYKTSGGSNDFFVTKYHIDWVKRKNFKNQNVKMCGVQKTT